MPVSNKRTFASTNSDEETLSSKKPRISSSKLLASKSAPVDSDEKSDTEDGQSDSNEDASGDTEVEEENSDNEGEDGQSNEEDEQDEQEVEGEDQGETTTARPSFSRAPSPLVCHCGRLTEMKQSLNGLSHNRGEWFGKCASGSCGYWKWAGGLAQQRFNYARDAQFDMHWPGDAESGGGNNDPEDYSGIDPEDYENHIDEPPEGKVEARLREMWRSKRREQKGRNSDSDSEGEEDEADFQQWVEELGGPDVDNVDSYHDD
ncbi:hypothetical protein FIBSPDRAFT_869031 [Athelia psychrophila]|uniref:Uncharacterized protein n=1 Tax=Athelia psychrophila TaxID=1759441 RepID=A0A166CKI0_9AGAM|nr:hypothetical protein FIBSPDRAFT_869031 [Fibularhizoctonia sp. CBS 109695]